MVVGYFFSTPAAFVYFVKVGFFISVTHPVGWICYQQTPWRLKNSIRTIFDSSTEQTMIAKAPNIAFLCDRYAGRVWWIILHNFLHNAKRSRRARLRVLVQN